MTDTSLYLAINGWAGRNAVLDSIISFLANDYFMIIAMCSCLVFLWFGTRHPEKRNSMQKTILITLIGIGITNGFVALCNAHFFRIRPFNALPAETVHLLFYKPTDSSFPSNFAAVLFAIAFSVMIRNRRWGSLFLVMALIGGFSRVFVGIHYPLDILGGMAFGAAGFGIGYTIGRLLDPFVEWVLSIIRYFHLA
jgi:undecaprenyl-diphosphatase